MKKLTRIVYQALVSVIALVAMAAGIQAESLPAPARAGAAREIAMSNNTLPEIHVTVLESTLIVLPSGEKVMKTFAGDTANWLVETMKEPSRFISVKAKPDAAGTNILHIVSDHGNEYSVSLVKVVGPGATFDPKVTLDAGDQQTKDNLAKPPEFVPAADVERYKKEAEDAKAKAQSAIKDAEQAKERDASAIRSSYPSTLKFDYHWDTKVGDRLGVQEIFRDDKFTYIRANSQETAALYEVKDGKPSLINFDFANGLYTVPKILDRGYLAIGKQKMDFARN